MHPLCYRFDFDVLNELCNEHLETISITFKPYSYSIYHLFDLLRKK